MTKEFYNHYSEFPMSKWRWPDFTPGEIASRTRVSNGVGPKGPLLLDYRSMDMLQELRDRIGKPFYVNSAFRSEEYNQFIGGASRSYHVQGMAFDISMHNHNVGSFVSQAKALGFKGIGYYNSFTHIDTRDTNAEWYG